MAEYQLKVMLNTSIPNIDNNGKTEYVELTSDLLYYEPPPKNKITLTKYPFFHPEANYPRKTIQNMEYHERLEVFFNIDKFKEVVFKDNTEDDINYEDIKEEKDEKKDEDDEDEEKVLEKQKKMNQNFEFTIQTILCTGFPVQNYFQSMEYYDPKLRTKKFTLKGSSWFPFLPSRFDRMFSYLKIGGSIYTVTGIVWINDALNHPNYRSALESSDKFEEERDPAKIEKFNEERKENSEKEMYRFILDVYDKNRNQATSNWKQMDYKKMNEFVGRRDRGAKTISEQNSLEIQIDFQKEFLEKMEYAPYYKDKFSDLTWDVSGTTKYYSKYGNNTDISNNIFLKRGSTGNDEDINKVKNAIPENNKPYVYWNAIHNNVLRDNTADNIESLTRNTTTRGIFSASSKFNPYSSVTKQSTKMYSKIYERYKSQQEFVMPEIANLDTFFKDFGLESTYENEKKKKTEVYWFYKTILENKKAIKKQLEKYKDDAVRTKLYNEIIDLRNEFIKNNNKLVEYLKLFLAKYTDEQISNLSNVSYKNDLQRFVKNMRRYDIEERAYDYVLNNSDYSEDPDKKAIEEIIREKFKNFNVYSDALKNLAQSRIVSNKYWKRESDKFVGTKKGNIKAVSGDGETELFKVLGECKDKNSKCLKKRKPQAVKYLMIGLDEIRFGGIGNEQKSAKTSGYQADTIYEVYVQSNVIKGKITKENYRNLKCSYLNYSLGSMYQNMRKKTNRNFITDNKMYFDLEADIKKAEEAAKNKKNFLFTRKKTNKNDNNNQKKNNDSKNNKKKPKKQGGTRKLKIKKRKSIHHSRRKYKKKHNVSLKARA